jgi:predicted DNA-binding protein YlxM (UPF0122 family)/GNAT superfamily N-acetyltransferase
MKINEVTSKYGNTVLEYKPGQLKKTDRDTYGGKPLPTMKDEPYDTVGLGLDTGDSYEMDTDDLRGEMIKLLRALPNERSAKILYMHFFNDLTIAEIAKHFNLSKGRVTDIVAAAMRQLHFKGGHLRAYTEAKSADSESQDHTLNPPSITTGDTVLVGKFKNSKATVKGFKTDDHGQPVLKTNKGDKKLFSLRLSKLEEDISVDSEDASDTFNKPGAEQVSYTDSKTGSRITIAKNHRSDGYASVTHLFVPEEFRGSGIGKKLLQIAMKDNPKFMGQVSSKAAATNAYKAGRRPYNKPNASLDDIFNTIDQESSVNLMTTEGSEKTDFDTFHQEYTKLNKDVKDAGAALNALTKNSRGATGMVSDEMKNSPEFKQAKMAYYRADLASKALIKGVPKAYLRRHSDLNRQARSRR